MLIAVLLVCNPAGLWGQAYVDNSSEQPEEGQSATLFPHSETSRFWAAGQLNFIFQSHPDFHSRYEGPNSLRSRGESETSRVLTLYTGAQITRKLEVLADFESAGGRGLSDALGLAGFTNLDVVRNPSLGSSPYLARLMFHAIVPLSTVSAKAERTFTNLATKLPERRIELHAGRLSTVDFFDVNSIGSDSHLQFMNWAIDNNGAYDYAADTRGYTYGMVAAYEDRDWGIRFGEMFMPKVANGIDIEWNLARAHAENTELELRPRLFANRSSTVRVLGFRNTANMGDYRQAIARFRQGLDPRPIIENTRRQGTVKYGFGLNAEQELTKTLGAYLRLGWNEGRHESFVYTEIDSTASFGIGIAGGLWQRPLDKIGVAFATNGIARDHQQYLRLGGLGFLLGDGNLNYGRENIVEGYYTVHLWRGVFGSFDLQHINNPGYNRDRGPVLVPALRLHVEL